MSASKAKTSRARAPTASPGPASPTCPRSARSSPTSRSTRTCASACSQPRKGAPHWSIPQMYDFFPQLKDRRTTAAGMLSGGEQQMLTMCRSLLGNPTRHPDRRADRGARAEDRRGRDRCHPRHLPSRASRSLLVEQKLTIAMRVSQRRLRHGPWPDRLRGHARQPAQCARDPPRMARGELIRTDSFIDVKNRARLHAIVRV